MDLRNKRIYGISNLLLCFFAICLYGKIGAMGMMHVAIVFEILSFLNILFFSSLPDVINPKYNLKTAGCYCFFATICMEAIMYLIYRFVILPSEIMYVGTLLIIFMFFVPIYALFQWLKGLYQATVQKQIGALSHIIFVVLSAVFCLLLSVILGDYGTKAAVFMQSIKLEHFYVLLCVSFGVFVSLIVSFVFLLWISRKYKGEISFVIRASKQNEKVSLPGLVNIFTTQFSESYLTFLKRVPIWLLLVFSLGEMKNENYLFGHLYGAVLPILGLAWQLASLGLIVAKKHMYLYFKKRMREEYYYKLVMILTYVVVCSVFLFACIFALHKPYLAIWSLQTSSVFMTLTKWSAFIALLGLPYITLVDILLERNQKKACSVSLLLGLIMFVITAFICNNFLGAGSALYIVSIVLYLLVSIFFLAWFLKNEVGLSYFSVLKRSYKVLATHIMLAIILIIVQSFIYTAFGAFGTLTICLTISFVMQWLFTRAFRLFSKEERKILSIVTVLKAVLQLPYESV